MRRFFVIFLCLLCLPGRAGGEAMYMRVVARGNSLPAQTEKITVRNIVLLLGPGAAEKMGCRVEVKQWQPDEKTPPARTWYITIGAGAGRNWWGVLYPESIWWAAEEGKGEEISLSFPFFSWLYRLFIPR